MYSVQEEIPLLVLQSQKQYLNRLEQELAHSNGLILLTGGPGTGKSTLLELLRKQLQGHQFRTAIVSDVAGPPNALLAVLLTHLFQSVQNFQTAHLIKQFKDFLSTQQLLAKSTVILVDNADSLSQASFDVLIQLLDYASDDVNFHIVLCGSISLVNKLKTTKNYKVFDNVNYHCQIRPLIQSETLEFINKYLQSHKWQGNTDGFSNSLSEIYTLSSGILSTIKKYCDLFFLYDIKNHSPQEKLFVDDEMVDSFHLRKGFGDSRKSRTTAESIANNFTHISFDQETKSRATSVETIKSVKSVKRHFNHSIFATIATSYLASAIIAMLIIQQQQNIEKQPNSINIIRNIEKLADLKTPVTIHEDDGFIENFEKEKAVLPESREEDDVTEDDSDTVISRITLPEKEVSESALDKKVFMTPEPPIAVEKIVSQVAKESSISNVVSPDPVFKMQTNIPGTNETIFSANTGGEFNTLVEADVTHNSLILASANSQQLGKSASIILLDNPFDELALSGLIARFEVAYQFGDLQRIADMLSDNVQSNQVSGKFNLQSEYEKLFGITEMRRMNISNMEWKSVNDGMLGEGTFKVKLLEKGSNRENTYSGNIVIRIAQQNRQLLFSEIHYNYSNL